MCGEVTAGGRSVKQKQARMPTRVSAWLNKGAPTSGDTTSTRPYPRTLMSNTGDLVVLEDLRKTSKRWVLPLVFSIFFCGWDISLCRPTEMHSLWIFSWQLQHVEYDKLFIVLTLNLFDAILNHMQLLLYPTWQLLSAPHGNCWTCPMATLICPTWQLLNLIHGNSCFFGMATAY